MSDLFCFVSFFFLCVRCGVPTAVGTSQLIIFVIIFLIDIMRFLWMCIVYVYIYLYNDTRYNVFCCCYKYEPQGKEVKHLL